MTQTTRSALDDRKAALFALTATPTLITSLLAVEADKTPFDPKNPEPTQERNMVRAWTIEELERRHPAAAQTVEDVFDAAYDAETGDWTEVDYVKVLVNAVLAELETPTAP